MTLGLAVPVVILLLAASALGGWPVTRGVLRQASRSADAGEPQEASQPADESDGPEGSGPVPCCAAARGSVCSNASP
ncbi:hypothetical protein [Cellulomonas soli]